MHDTCRLVTKRTVSPSHAVPHPRGVPQFHNSETHLSASIVLSLRCPDTCILPSLFLLRTGWSTRGRCNGHQRWSALWQPVRRWLLPKAGQCTARSAHSPMTRAARTAGCTVHAAFSAPDAAAVRTPIQGYHLHSQHHASLVNPHLFALNHPPHRSHSTFRSKPPSRSCAPPWPPGAAGRYP